MVECNGSSVSPIRTHAAGSETQDGYEPGSSWPTAQEDRNNLPIISLDGELGNLVYIKLVKFVLIRRVSEGI